MNIFSNEYEVAFNSNDCKEIKFDFLGFPHGMICVNLICYSFVSFFGYLYGRHRGIDSLNVSHYESISNLEAKRKTKIVYFLSNAWFILSTFIFPYYLVLIWIFYALKFNIHYINDYNPWILSAIIAYLIYSFTVITSYSYYSNYDKCSKYCIRSNCIFIAILTCFIFYILMQNRKNNLNSFSFEIFYADDILYCFNLYSSQNLNVVIMSILIIIIAMINHHIFVLFRAISAKLLCTTYLSKPNDIYIHEPDNYDESIINAGTDSADDINFEDVLIRERSASRYAVRSQQPPPPSEPVPHSHNHRSHRSNRRHRHRHRHRARASVTEYDNEPVGISAMSVAAPPRMPKSPVAPPSAY